MGSATKFWEARADKRARKVDIKLPGNGNSNSHGARPSTKWIRTCRLWIRTSRLPIKKYLSESYSNFNVHAFDSVMFVALSKPFESAMFVAFDSAMFVAEADSEGLSPHSRFEEIQKRFRGGLVFKAHRLWNDSTLGWRVMKKKAVWDAMRDALTPGPGAPSAAHHGVSSAQVRFGGLRL